MLDMDRSSMRARHLCIVTHRLADVDAYCSAYALSHLFKGYVRDMTVVFPDGLNAIADRVMKSLPLDARMVIVERREGRGERGMGGEEEGEEEMDGHGITAGNVHAADVVTDMLNYDRDDLILIVDTNNPALLSSIAETVVKSNARKIVIDHHPVAEEASRLNADEIHIDVEASSTCEVVYRLFKRLRRRLKRDVAEALLLGVLTDTQNLTIARCSTISMVADVCRLASLERCRRMLAVEREYSERVARLRAAQRCRLYRVKVDRARCTAENTADIASIPPIIIAVSSVGSHHASAAKALVDLGADLSIVVSSEGSITKASLRSTQGFYARTGLHLGTDVLARVHSAGGGHSTAASIALEAGEGELVKRILGVIRERLGRLDAL
ncbi:MAG: DHH family phosphoesterase [Candidatus Nitrosocaldus sp.]|nr:DHH family phosphoesterase [Candidatus Nitrosocaldus sp.]MDW8275769.1 DHH family phosphoesterase [Candidatus Nitrosocaldus sp.]